MANTSANICSVNGTGPKGTVTHADTAMMAMESPTNASERVRAAAPLRALTSSMTVFLSRTVLLPAGQDMKEP